MTNWTTIRTKHPGECIHCHGQIPVGTEVKWCQGRGIQHLTRQECSSVPAESGTGRCEHGAERGAYCIPCEEAFLAMASADLIDAERRYRRNPSERLGDEIDELRKIVGKTQLELRENKRLRSERSIGVGSKFYARCADALPEWTVIAEGTAGLWDVYVAQVEDDEDYAGTTQGFTGDQIRAALTAYAA